MESSLIAAREKPTNGLGGLKHWRQDLVAGLLVSLISLPFSLGIAVASGAPPIAGLISAIVAGLLMPFLGGSYMTISGPAAGLAPALFATMFALGKGNMAVGYPLLLCVIAITGAVQVILASLKLARFSAIFPATVVEAMLASIGLLIIAKQLPYLLGVKFAAHDFFPYVLEIPSAVRRLNPAPMILCLSCLALIFVLSAAKARWLRVVPAQVVAVVVGTVVAYLMTRWNPAGPMAFFGNLLIHVPEDALRHVTHDLVFPHFSVLFADRTLWGAAAVGVITLTLIDGVESLATANVIDRIDPYRRRSDPNKVLRAMGILNICSSVVGGLTIIPGGVKSKANIEGGGRTLWANFYNAIVLIIFLFVATKAINLIPMAALAAVLIHTGYKLCRPAIWKHTAHVGREQLALFAITIVVTLATDLLIGIIVGVLIKLVMSVMLNSRSVQGNREDLGGAMGRALDLFRNPITSVSTAGGTVAMTFNRPMVCFNSLYVLEALAKIPVAVDHVVVTLTDKVTLIDHTSCDGLVQFADDFARGGRGEFEIKGLDRLVTGSRVPTGLRISPSAMAADRRSGLSSLARFGLQITSESQPAADMLATMALVPIDLDEVVAEPFQVPD